MTDDVLAGPSEALLFLKEISQKPLTMGSLRQYIHTKRIPFDKKGQYYFFSKQALRQWDAGRKYHKRHGK
jgi:hypothetical protein